MPNTIEAPVSKHKSPKPPSLKKRLEERLDACEQNNISPDRWFALPKNTLKNAFDREAKGKKPICDFEIAGKITAALDIKYLDKEAFFETYSHYHASDPHVFRALSEKKIKVGSAIRSLCAIRGTTAFELLGNIGAEPGTIKSWIGPTNQRTPSREYIMKMIDDDHFKLSRADQETFCEAAHCFIDKAHVIKCWSEDSINSQAAANGLIGLTYGGQNEMAAAKHCRQNNIADMVIRGLPRGEWLDLLNDCSKEQKKTALAKAGFYLDAAHINEAFAKEGGYDDWVSAVKSTYDLIDRDFTINRATMSVHRKGHQLPRADSLLSVYNKAREYGADLSWDVFKQTCERYLKVLDGTQSAKDMILRDLDSLSPTQQRR